MEACNNNNNSGKTRRQLPPPCYIEEGTTNIGLASLARIEAGFCGSNQISRFSSPSSSSSRSLCNNNNKRSGSLRNMSTIMVKSSTYVCSPKSTRRSFYDARYEDLHPHFLDSCFLCKKPLCDGKDIFMYRGDTPFCSEECRQEQIENDDAKERNWNMSSSMKSLRKKEQRTSTSPSKTRDYTSRTSTTVAAA